MQNQVKTLIGRMSIFHLGHEEVLIEALKSSEVVLLLIGSAGTARNIKNPFTYLERRELITAWYKEEVRKYKKYKDIKLGTLDIQPLSDHPYNDQAWIMEVQAAVANTRELLNIPSDWPNVLTGADRDASSWYLKAFGGFFQLDLVTSSNVGFDLSATSLRDDYFDGGNRWEYKTPSETIEFLADFKRTEHFKRLVEEYEFVKKYKKAWEAAPYAPTFVTVDACVVQSGHILVVERAAQPGKGLWALPGGFVEQNETLQNAAIRELLEETSIELSQAQLKGSIVSKEIFDNPGRSLRGRTITTCFLFKLKDTFALPKVKPQKGEVTKLMWIPLAVAASDTSKWYEDHHAIMTTMVARIKND